MRIRVLIPCLVAMVVVIIMAVIRSSDPEPLVDPGRDPDSARNRRTRRAKTASLAPALPDPIPTVTNRSIGSLAESGGMATDTSPSPVPLPDDLRGPNGPGPTDLRSPPEGTGLVSPILLSLDKPVSSSTAYPVIGELSMITDGDKQLTDGSYVELDAGLAYIEIDLGASFLLDQISIWRTPVGSTYHDVVVLLSTEQVPDSWFAVYNNDEDNSAGLGPGSDPEHEENPGGLHIPGIDQWARRVRIYSRGSSQDTHNRYTEVDVYGFSE